jgi:hypothetical protein
MIREACQNGVPVVRLKRVLGALGIAREKGLADERILDLKLVDQKLAQGKERVLAGLGRARR